ncbi:MAG: erythromycin esterase family protein [Acidobacteria bacterium]|nr:erythromycin esterase family protein [Acidobacteriota bacterium]
MRRLSIVMALVLLATAGSNGNRTVVPATLSVHPIDREDFTNPNQFSFLQSMFKDVEVVSLAESIHMTHEFPLVRLGIVRYLNEKMDFHALVMEGSAPDVWVAQDDLLNSGRTNQDCEHALGGFFGLWNTSEMQKLLSYEADTWHSPYSLYVAGYDIQPGNGHGSQGLNVFWQLANRLYTYAPPPEGFNGDRWTRDIAPLVGGYRPGDHDRVEAAIQTLEQWTLRAEPAVEKRYPNVPHAKTLELIPANLRIVLQFHDELAHPVPLGYQGLRDVKAAAFVDLLKKNLGNGKLMLWAHVSHLHMDNERSPASIGGILHRSLGTHLYTIVPYAESGGAVMIFPGNTNEDIGYGRVHGKTGDLEQFLGRLSKQDYFLDLRSQAAGPASDPVFWTREPIWVESGEGHAVIAKENDGLIWIKTVHAPDFTPFVFLASLIHYKTAVSALASSLVVVVVVYVLIRRRKQMRTRSL